MPITAATQVPMASRHCISVAPDVLLLDLLMSGPDGHGVLGALGDLPDQPAVVVLTSAGDDERLVRAIAAGATSYLLKTAGADQVIAGVRDAASGTATLSPALLCHLTSALQRDCSCHGRRRSRQFGSLA